MAVIGSFGGTGVLGQEADAGAHPAGVGLTSTLSAAGRAISQIMRMVEVLPAPWAGKRGIARLGLERQSLRGKVT